MNARDELYNYADDAHLGGEYLDELLDRVEEEARTAGSVDDQRSLRRLELLEASLVEYINGRDTPGVASHILTGLMALASIKVEEEFPAP
jgi:hypothetical protein